MVRRAFNWLANLLAIAFAVWCACVLWREWRDPQFHFLDDPLALLIGSAVAICAAILWRYGGGYEAWKRRYEKEHTSHPDLK